MLEREIGHGGMGRVFSGRDLRLDRTVAIKMLRTQDAALAIRFEREVKLAARLQHPGVVPVYDAGFWPSGEPFLVMKLVLGQSLARAIKDADTRADRLALLPQVIAAAEAVAYAHDQGIVHRDLKPSNILVGAFGETVVVDWGLAKDLRAGGSEGGSPSPLPAPERASPESGLPSPLPSPASGRGEEVRFCSSSLAPTFSRKRERGIIRLPRPAKRGEGWGEGPAIPRRAPSLERRRTCRPSRRPARPSIRAPTFTRSARSCTTCSREQRRSRSTPPAPLSRRACRPISLAIVDKALAADAARRYPSAFELADDLKRFAGGQLVAARRYSPLARAGRFVAHHPIAVAPRSGGARWQRRRPSLCTDARAAAEPADSQRLQPRIRAVFAAGRQPRIVRIRLLRCLGAMVLAAALADVARLREGDAQSATGTAGATGTAAGTAGGAPRRNDGHGRDTPDDRRRRLDRHRDGRWQRRRLHAVRHLHARRAASTAARSATAARAARSNAARAPATACAMAGLCVGGPSCQADHLRVQHGATYCGVVGDGCGMKLDCGACASGDVHRRASA